MINYYILLLELEVAIAEQDHERVDKLELTIREHLNSTGLNFLVDALTKLDQYYLLERVR